MAKKTKKPLLNEGTIRRMMKLADMDMLGDGFISETYSQFAVEPSLEEQEEEVEDVALDMEPDLPGDEGPAEEVPEEVEGEGEVVITDEEAQDIIDLADKLKGAVGGEEAPEEELPPEPEAELEVDAEEDLEAPGTRPVYEQDEELYEAALKGLNIEVVDDEVQKRLQELKESIYKRVVSRLLKESKDK